MSPTVLKDVLAALQDFVTRIDALDPAGTPVGAFTVRLGGQEARLMLRAPVAQALVEALQAYRDPRDQGGCAQCGGRRLDHNFVCRDCGRPNGLFGQTDRRTGRPAWRARVRSDESPPTGPPRQRLTPTAPPADLDLSLPPEGER